MTRYCINQFSPYFLCRVSWLPIITNLGSLSQIKLNEYQLKSITFNYNICGIWKIFNNTRQRKYGLNNYNRCGLWKIFNNTRQRKYRLIMLAHTFFVLCYWIFFIYTLVLLLSIGIQIWEIPICQKNSHVS
jgi:hypothetical protein